MSRNCPPREFWLTLFYARIAMTRLSSMTIRLSMCCLALCAGSAKAQRGPSRVSVAEAKLLDADVTISLVGTVRAVRQSRVAAELAGLVRNMPAREGDAVSAGDIICELDDSTLSLELARAQAQLDSVSARRQELIAGTREEELRRLKAMWDESIAEHERWKKEMARIERLYRDRDSNDKEIYDARANLLTAMHRTEAARAAYEQGVQGERAEVILQAEYDVKEYEATVHKLQSDLQKNKIRAPFSGYVTTRNAEVGEWVPSGGQVVEVVDLSSVLVRVDAPEFSLPHLHTGDTVRVKVDALSKTFTGKIKHIVRQADLTAHTFPVDIEIDNTDGRLAAGMFARASISAGQKNKFTAVPKDAIVSKGGVDYIAVARPGKKGWVASLQGITAGSDIGDWITITSDNLKPGAKVVIRGNEGIRPFPMPIVIVDAAGTPVDLDASATQQSEKSHPDGHNNSSHTPGEGDK